MQGGGESGSSSAAASRPWGLLQSGLGPSSESSGDQSADRGRPLLSPSPRAHSFTPPKPSRGGALGFLSTRGHRQQVEAGGLDFYVSAPIPRIPGARARSQQAGLHMAAATMLDR